MPTLLILQQRFWHQHPALFYSLAFLLGSTFSFTHSVILLFPSILLIAPFLSYPLKHESRIRIFLNIGIMIFSFIYTESLVDKPDLPDEGLLGTACIEITSVQSKKMQFGTKWLYQGNLKSFTIEKNGSTKKIAKNIPFTLTFPKKNEIERPSADYLYKLQALLKKTRNGNYFLQIRPEEMWLPLQKSSNLAEIRFKMKTAFATYIEQSISNHRSSTFLTGILTGEFNDRLMAHEFARFGLQHIMAISGFHFALLAAIFTFFFRWIFREKIAIILTSLLLTFYCLFLGFGPSIIRAWISILIINIGHWTAKSSRPMNTLGIAMLGLLIYDPCLSQHLGFQFSFAITLSILLLFSPTNEYLQLIFKKRSLGQVIQMNRIDQHGYFLLFLFRQALSLSIAVNITAFPMTLFYFQKFPFMGLVYNLFFPFFVSISMFFLVMSSLLHFIFPPLGLFLHSINNHLTKIFLSFTSNLPPSFDFNLYIEPFSSDLLVFYLSLIFLFGIAWKGFLDDHQQHSQELIFI